MTVSTPDLVTCADGRAVRLRAARAEDRARFAAAVASLSDQSRYRRFHTPLVRLAERDLDRLMNLDPAAQSVVFALDERAAARIVAVGRIAWVGDDDAEVAVTVHDAWQGQGVGGALLDRLCALADRRCVRQLSAETLAENRAALGLMRSRGFVALGPGGPVVCWRQTRPS